MSYTPPAQNAVDFALTSFTPPAQTEVNFELAEVIQKLKVWDGANWVIPPATKRWDGSQWVAIKAGYHWDGSAWQKFWGWG